MTNSASRGDWGEDARQTMPWTRPETWDTAACAAYRALIALRRGSPALVRGGIRYAHVSADAIAYVREARDESVLCLASRAARTCASTVRRSRRTALDTLAGEDVSIDGDHAVLPADGPAFHAWRLV